MMAGKKTNPRPAAAATQETGHQAPAAALIALPATPPAEDAKLFVLCDAFDAEEAKASAAWDSLSADDAAEVADGCVERQRVISQEIGATPARTLWGLLRKLHTIAVNDPDLIEARPGRVFGELMIASVLQDALGLPTPRPSVDQFRAARADKEKAITVCRELLNLRAAAAEANRKADELTRQVVMLGVVV